MDSFESINSQITLGLNVAHPGNRLTAVVYDGLRRENAVLSWSARLVGVGSSGIFTVRGALLQPRLGFITGMVTFSIQNIGVGVECEIGGVQVMDLVPGEEIAFFGNCQFVSLVALGVNGLRVVVG